MTNKNSIHAFLLCVSFLFTAELCAQEPSFEYKDIPYKGCYSCNSFKNKNDYVKPTSEGVEFYITYYAGAYNVDKYSLKKEGNTLIVNRNDIPNSAQKHMKPYILEGTIRGLTPGEYIIRIQKHNEIADSLDVLFEAEFVIPTQEDIIN